MKSFVFILALLSLTTTHAKETKLKKVQLIEKKTVVQEIEQPKEPTIEVEKDLTKEILEKDSSIELRATKKWSVLANYSAYDLWLPGKLGVTATYIETKEAGWEIEWLRRSYSLRKFIDIGGVTENRFSIVRTSYAQRNSFRFIYGLSYNTVKINIGSALMSSVSSGSYPNADLFELSTINGVWGVGNRWQFEKMALGIDWFVVHVPFIVTNSYVPYLDSDASEQYKNDVRDARNLVEHFPLFTIIKFQIGVSF